MSPDHVPPEPNPAQALASVCPSESDKEGSTCIAFQESTFCLSYSNTVSHPTVCSSYFQRFAFSTKKKQRKMKPLTNQNRMFYLDRKIKGPQDMRPSWKEQVSEPTILPKLTFWRKFPQTTIYHRTETAAQKTSTDKTGHHATAAWVKLTPMHLSAEMPSHEPHRWDRLPEAPGYTSWVLSSVPAQNYFLLSSVS